MAAPDWPGSGGVSRQVMTSRLEVRGAARARGNRGAATRPALHSAARKAEVAAGVGTIAGIAMAALVPWQLAVQAGWDVAAAAFLVASWSHILRFDARQTRDHARADDPGRQLTEAIMVAVGIAFLADVGLVLLQAGHAAGGHRAILVSLGVFSVVLTWATVHTVYTFRYARAYFSSDTGRGAVDFNEDSAPDYHDFAYLAFTVGMTFQVSDTDLRTKAVRRIALGHALISYLYGAVIVAMSINMVASLLH